MTATLTFEEQVVTILNRQYGVDDFRYDDCCNYRSATTGSDFQLLDRDGYATFAHDWARDNFNPEPSDDEIQQAWEQATHIEVDGEPYALISQN